LKVDRDERIKESELLNMEIFNKYREWEKEIKKKTKENENICEICENGFIKGNYIKFKY
jgi:hypothetical protein